MTKAEQYTFVTSLLGGYQMDTTLFDTFLGIAKNTVEGLRPWVKLRTVDTSQTVSASGSYLTAKALPSDFRKWYDLENAIVLSTASQQIPYVEIPISQRLRYRDYMGRFYADYTNNQFYICGPVSGSFTANLNYIRSSAALSADSDTWEFPSEYHPILGLYVAGFWKSGVDYDPINKPQADEHSRLANVIYTSMVKWDGDLQSSQTRGLDPFGTLPVPGTVGSLIS